MTTAILDTPDSSRSRGRPREFDMDSALDQALHVFSQQGYHAASISDLTEAMGLTAGSLYKAFKDKRGVFLAVFDRYRLVRRQVQEKQLEKAATGRDKVEALVRSYASSASDDSGREGCLVVASANELKLFDTEVAERVTVAFEQNEAFLAALIDLGQRDGSISMTIDAATAARTLLCVTNGMRIVGKTGRSSQDMAAVATAAMKILT